MTRFPLEPRQFGSTAPSVFENELADVIEETFARGVHDLPGIVASLNLSRVRPPDGAGWTEERFLATVKRLGG